jgi:MarR-like DNA-binding transcriptional regulator SgrR of sgrS sRNA
MKPFAWRSNAASNVIHGVLLLVSLLFVSTALTAQRPQYGGTLHVAMQGSPMSLDPTDVTQADSLARRNLLSLIFDTLVTVDDRGRTHPALATAWQASSGNQRWQFTLRRGVRFHDGSPFTAEIAASSLRMANPSWKVFTDGYSVIVERDRPVVDLPSELALTHNSIVKKQGDGKLSGTGPFSIEDWQPGKHLTLAAEENYWRGREFLNTIEVEIGRSLRDQQIELESGKADLVEIAPEQPHVGSTRERHVGTSQPVELIAIVFGRDANTDEEKQLRHALALSIERSTMRNVLLRGAGEPAASLLPNWMTGYAFTFSTDADLKQARHDRELVRSAQAWTVRYDANDSIGRVLVERIALNAKDAGIVLQPSTEGATDLRLVRISLASADPWIALSNLSEKLGLPVPKTEGESIADLYEREQALLAEQRVIPLFYLPAEWESSAQLRGWRPGADGSWRLDEAWLEKQK